MSENIVAPFWYRQFLRFAPDTPPPLFGASRAYWAAETFKLAFSIGVVLTLVLLAFAHHIAAPA
ncbi:MAG: hypothetical protein HC782_05865, partial [Gammaproteobacteria bacterium]|nr:hypothetical protein [Gammaproteobacteria bacterium]